MSKIEWTDRTWNPLAGCTMVSRACENCYAMRMAFRLEHMGQEKYKGTTRKTEGGKIVWTGKINFDEKALLEPLKWKKPQRVFVNSMSDLFHEDVPYEWIDKVFAVMAATPHITYQILTKRPERMAEYLDKCTVNWYRWRKICDAIFPLTGKSFDFVLPLPNVWLGTTIENQAEADKRVPHLLRCPAAVHFVSCEPLMGPVNLNKESYPLSEEEFSNQSFPLMLPNHWMHLIDWVIAGGESGPKAEPSHPDWFRSLRDQCHAYAVPFLFKQWGEWGVGSDFKKKIEHVAFCNDGSIGVNKLSISNEDYQKKRPTMMRKCGKKSAGNFLDGKVWNQFPKGGNEERK